MNIVRLHELIDQWYQEELKSGQSISPPTISTESVEVKRELPKDKRVVRTKSQGDKVFYLDDIKKTRQWVTSPEVLDSLGFDIGDVTEVNDEELLKYQMATPIARPVNGA